METLTLDLPTMYGDHHVLEVRRILLELAGVEDVYASSGFRMAEITYDPAQIDEDAIKAKLDEAGYLGELLVDVESSKPVNELDGEKVFYRHSAAYEQTGTVIGFAQNVAFAGRPLWPCPGMGPVQTIDD
jgi:copper chaperone CopZ